MLPAFFASTGTLSGQFTAIDWMIVFGYLLVTTVIGGALAGKQQTMKDFFLGGRKLPWYAVSGSIIATELSALTFVGVPYIIFRPTGDFTYMQLGLIGALLARIVVAYLLIPAYYKREIYSPYDYMGNQLGVKVRSMTTVLFAISGMLAQSARVYLTAVVLQILLHEPLSNLAAFTGIPGLAWAVAIVGVVAMGWTLMGGIATVIWTDVILFFVFVIGAFTALGFLIINIPGGFGEILALGAEADKFRFFNFDPSPTEAFTIWTAAIASTWGGIDAYGTNQLMAQRYFCCRTVRDAKLAVITSWVGQVVTFSVLLVGVGLYAYYTHFPLTGEALAAYENEPDSIFPIFIVTVIPVGLSGLIIAGIFAAAISSLDSILAALSQTTMSAFYVPWRERKLKREGRALPSAGDPVTDPHTSLAAAATPEDKRMVLVSRVLVVFWTVILCGMAILISKAAQYYGAILELGLAMAGFVGGTLLAGFFLSFYRDKLDIDGTGFLWAAPLGVLMVFALSPFPYNYTWALGACWAGVIGMSIAWMIRQRFETMTHQTVLLLVVAAILLLAAHYGHFTVEDPETGAVSAGFVAWPWYAPIGSLTTFLLGWGLANRRSAQTAPKDRK